MEMTKENFDKLMRTEGVKVELNEKETFLETIYPFFLCSKQFTDVRAAYVFQYSDKWTLIVAHKDRSKSVTLDFLTEKEIYKELYRMVYLEKEEEILVEDNDNEKPGLHIDIDFHLFTKKNVLEMPNGKVQVMEYKSHGGRALLVWFAIFWTVCLYRNVPFPVGKAFGIGLGIALVWDIVTFLLFSLKVKLTMRKLLKDFM